METQFVKVQSNKDIIISVLLIILGSILIATPVGASLNVVGGMLFFTGLIMVFVLKSNYKNLDDGMKYAKKELYFVNGVKDTLLAAMKSTPESIEVNAKANGNTLRLDVYYNKAANKAYMQLFEYVPYRYEVCSDMMEYDIAQVEKLIK